MSKGRLSQSGHYSPPQHQITGHFGSFRQRTLKRHRPHPSRPEIFRLLTETNNVIAGHTHHKLENNHLRSLDLKSLQKKQPLLERIPPQPQATENQSVYRETRRQPFNKTSRPLIFLRPYTKASADRASLQKTKFQLYQQMHKFTEPVQQHIQVQYLTEYGDQFGEVLSKTMERKPRTLNITMVRDKIMKKSRPSRYLERLSSNFAR